MKKLLLLISGGIILINGIFITLFANFTLGTVLTDLLGILLLGRGIFYKKISELTKKRWIKALKNLIKACIILELLFVAGLAVYGQWDNVTYNEDALVVLGAAVRGERVTVPLKLRLDKAVCYHEKNPDAAIVVTGGKGAQESVTEAAAMEKYLINKGVSKDKIIKEDKATSTNENMRFSKKILDSYFKKDYSIAVVTNNFHVYRGTAIAKNEGFEKVTHLHAGLQLHNLIPCYLRETLAVLKMWVFD